ncbi:MAG: hypothetical protein GYB66_07410, partial [Chloroflexi bacterium]|nr:hypothetical protein [Chloroflexota bacterium]
SGCPETLVFDLSRNQFSAQPIALPEDVIPREIAQVHFVANESRLLWLTTSGNVYLQSLREPDVGLWSAVMLEEVAGADATVVDVNLVPTGVAAVLELDSGSYVLLNTVSRDVQPLSGFDLVAPTDSDEPDTPEPTPAEE